MTRPVLQKKIKLGVAERHTKWAPFWIILRKFGRGAAGHRHPSEVTSVRRHWRRTKLKIKARRTPKSHLG